MKTFKTDIFPFAICIAEVKEMEKVKESFTDESGEEISFPKGARGVVCRALSKDFKIAHSLIVVNKEYATFGTAAHGANHSACDLLENIGVPRCFQTEEVYSYVIGFIAQKIYETIWE